MGGVCTYGGEERCIQIFGGETRGKQTTRRRWEDNIKMNLQEMEWKGRGLD
jgi:hypothetical protein